MNKKEELKNLVKKYNISNDDLVNFYSLSHELKKLGVFDIFKREKLKMELFKIKKKYDIGFLNYGDFIIYFNNSPIITTKNIRTYFFNDEELEHDRKRKLKELKDHDKNKKSLKLELTKKYDDCKTLIDDCKTLIKDIKNTQGKKLYLNKIEIRLNEQKQMIEANFRFQNNELVISDLDLLKDLNKKLSRIYYEISKTLVELNKLNNLKQSQTNVLSELDKDGNGEVDVVEGNDFNTLLKKHQKSIVEVDRNYVQQFVKVSSYLKTKKGNIQSIFNSIKDTPNQEVLNKYVEILKGEIHTYNLILFNSLNMIVSLVEDDMITFYEIYEMFDTLNMFDSKYEKDISQKLTNIGDGLESLMNEIRDMGNQISNSIDELSYITEQSNEQLSNQLSEINSTLKVGNLISSINLYQNYKINKNTKSLRG